MRGMKFILFLIVCGLFMLTVNAQCEEWITLGENKTGQFFYDRTSISRIKSGVVAVDMTVITSTAGSKELAVGIPLKGVSVTRFHDVIDCRSRFYECQRIRYYDRKGKLLADTETDKAESPPPGFRAIPYDTPIERLADIVCK